MTRSARVRICTASKSALCSTAGLVLVLACACSSAAESPDSVAATTVATPAPEASATSSPGPVNTAEVKRQVDLFLSPGGRYDELIRAVLVMVDGVPIVEHYGTNGSPETTGDIFSVTTSVMSMLIGIAIGEGHIGSVDQTLADLLPTYAAAMAPGVAEVTLRQLLR